jgi:hypothetical protein
MKADPADCFGIGEDAGLVGFVLARVGIYGSLWGGRKITTTWLYGSDSGFLEQAVQDLSCPTTCFYETRLLRNSGAKSAPFGQQTVRSSGSK